MATKKTRFSTSRNRAIEERAAIDIVIDGLSDRQTNDVSSDDLESLSDLSRPAAERLAKRWLDIPHPVRTRLVNRMVSLFETDIEHHFDEALVVALDDIDDDIKLVAFGGLTDTTVSSLLHYLTHRLPSESNPTVRAAGAEVSGQFALQSELNALDGQSKVLIRDTLYSFMDSDESEVVRLRALESAGYLVGEESVVQAIEAAWESGRHDAQVSALRAMGRQSDPRWLSLVLSEFANDEPEIRFEAVRAAGALGGQHIVPRIIDLTGDEDVEVQTAAIASLGMLGGDVALRALRHLERSESVAISDAAGAALDEALLVDNAARPPNALWQS